MKIPGSKDSYIDDMYLSHDMALIMKPYYEWKLYSWYYRGKVNAILAGEKKAEEYAKTKYKRNPKLPLNNYYGSRDYLDNVVAIDVMEKLKKLIEIMKQADFVFNKKIYRNTKHLLVEIYPEYFKNLLERNKITQNEIDLFKEIIKKRNKYLEKNKKVWHLDSIKNGNIDYRFFMDLEKTLASRGLRANVYQNKDRNGTERELRWRIGDHEFVVIGHSLYVENAGGIPSSFDLIKNTLTEEEIKKMILEIYPEDMTS